jgi:hypothetical protein
VKAIKLFKFFLIDFCVCMHKVVFKLKLIFLDIKLWSGLRPKTVPVLSTFPNILGHFSQKIFGRKCRNYFLYIIQPISRREILGFSLQKFKNFYVFQPFFVILTLVHRRFHVVLIRALLQPTKTQSLGF